MFRSTNPILSKDEAFAPAAPQQGYGQQQGYAQYGQQPTYQGYPGQQPQGPQDPQQYAPAPQQQGRMTIEDVLTKSSILMGGMIVVAALAWLFLSSTGNIAMAMPMVIVGGLGTFVFSFVVAARRKVTPVMAVVFALLEGMFVGAFSAVFELLYPGIVVQAVFGTLIVAVVMLAAYRFKVIRATPRFYRIIGIATVAFAAAMLLNFVLYLFGINMGLRDSGGGVGMLPIIVSLIGVVLASMNLVIDFDQIEQGVRNGAPSSQSWLAAFGLTVTMVWLYTEILRILSYFRN